MSKTLLYILLSLTLCSCASKKVGTMDEDIYGMGLATAMEARTSGYYDDHPHNGYTVEEQVEGTVGKAVMKAGIRTGATAAYGAANYGLATMSAGSGSVVYHQVLNPALRELIVPLQTLGR